MHVSGLKNVYKGLKKLKQSSLCPRGLTGRQAEWGWTGVSLGVRKCTLLEGWCLCRVRLHGQGWTDLQVNQIQLQNWDAGQWRQQSEMKGWFQTDAHMEEWKLCGDGWMGGSLVGHISIGNYTELKPLESWDFLIFSAWCTHHMVRGQVVRITLSLLQYQVSSSSWGPGEDVVIIPQSDILENFSDWFSS